MIISTYRASVIIPAHDEEASIGRLLGRLQAASAEGTLEVVVVCNGCTDRTAEVACQAAPAARVVILDEAGKHAAMRRGDLEATVTPRIYLDADVDVDAHDLLLLADAVKGEGARVAGPVRQLVLARSSWLVRSYYHVWERLPQVAGGLFGRGVIAVSDDALARIAMIPEMLSDDLAVSEAFAPDERVIVDGASVLIRPPLTARDLVRRRIRVATGNAQFDSHSTRPRQKTDLRSVARLMRTDARSIPAVVVFVGVTLIARTSARRRIRSGDFRTWERDESSRTGGPR